MSTAALSNLQRIALNPAVILAQFQELDPPYEFNLRPLPCIVVLAALVFIRHKYVLGTVVVGSVFLAARFLFKVVVYSIQTKKIDALFNPSLRLFQEALQARAAAFKDATKGEKVSEKLLLEVYEGRTESRRWKVKGPENPTIYWALKESAKVLARWKISQEAGLDPRAVQGLKQLQEGARKLNGG